MPADPGSFVLLAALVLAAAILYSSVGHGGASAYLAAMALFGVRPAAMKPAALVMNIVVASAGTARWWSAGPVPRDLLWPLRPGASSAFILVNSVAGLLGHLTGARDVPQGTGLLAAVALAGGLYGSWLGARRLPPLALRRLLAAVLLLAGGRLALGG